jgi:hypothetical protein
MSNGLFSFFKTTTTWSLKESPYGSRQQFIWTHQYENLTLAHREHFASGSTTPPKILGCALSSAREYSHGSPAHNPTPTVVGDLAIGQAGGGIENRIVGPSLLKKLEPLLRAGVRVEGPRGPRLAVGRRMK